MKPSSSRIVLIERRTCRSATPDLAARRADVPARGGSVHGEP